MYDKLNFEKWKQYSKETDAKEKYLLKKKVMTIYDGQSYPINRYPIKYYCNIRQVKINPQISNGWIKEFARWP